MRFPHRVYSVLIVSHCTSSTTHVIGINQDKIRRWLLNSESCDNLRHYKRDRNGDVSYAIAVVVGPTEIHRNNTQKHLDAIHSYVISSHPFPVLTSRNQMFNQMNRPLLVTKLQKKPYVRISSRRSLRCGMIQWWLTALRPSQTHQTTISIVIL